MTQFDMIHSHTTSVSWLQPVVWIATRVGRLFKAISDRHGAAQLYRMSDNDLKDIGVTRNDVDREVMKPVDWR